MDARIDSGIYTYCEEVCVFATNLTDPDSGSEISCWAVIGDGELLGVFTTWQPVISCELSSLEELVELQDYLSAGCFHEDLVIYIRDPHIPDFCVVTETLCSVPEESDLALLQRDEFWAGFSVPAAEALERVGAITVTPSNDDVFADLEVERPEN